jgi:hypothetical protein
LGKKQDPISKIRAKRVGGMAQAVEHEALSSNPSTAENFFKRRERCTRHGSLGSRQNSMGIPGKETSLCQINRIKAVGKGCDIKGNQSIPLSEKYKKARAQK